MISVYRSVAGRHGVTVPAKRLAKLKTVSQQLTVGVALCPVTADDNLAVVSQSVKS